MTPAEVRALREINAGIYAFDAASLREALGKLSTDNDQGEEYLTERLLPASEIDRIEREAPLDLIRFQDVAAQIPLEERPTMRDWLDRFHAGLAVAA